MLEMALVLPLLMLILFGIIEYGWLFLKAQQINNACRQGARVGSLFGSGAGDVEAAVLNALTMVNMGESGYTLTFVPADPSDMESGEALTVSISVPYPNILAIGVPFIPVPGTLQAEVVMAKEAAP